MQPSIAGWYTQRFSSRFCASFVARCAPVMFWSPPVAGGALGVPRGRWVRGHVGQFQAPGFVKFQISREGICVGRRRRGFLHGSHRVDLVVAGMGAVIGPSPTYHDRVAQFDFSARAVIGARQAAVVGARRSVNAAMSLGIPRKIEITKLSTSHRKPQNPLLSQCTWAKSSTL